MTPSRRLLVPLLSTIVMFAIVFGLGTWQVTRLVWKRELLATIALGEARPAERLPPDPMPFARLQADGTWRPDAMGLYGFEVRSVPGGTVPGARLLGVLDVPGRRPVLVDRGWVPTPMLPVAGGPTTIEGYMRPGEPPGFFAATDDLPARRFYTLDPKAIGRALGVPEIAPFVLVALGPPAGLGAPDPARTLPRPPNDHLVYAATWYGLAVTLLLIFALYARALPRQGEPAA